MKKNRKSKKKSGVLAITTIVMIIWVVVCILFTGYQLYVQEQGIIDVCATQQDTYVQLVLDQINLKENREDEEIIDDILSTLDSSSNKYWTFSKDHDMLFVKDVIETNRYKGLTTASYYDSDTAKEFLDSLQVNHVIHKNIVIDDKNYVASGVAFQYGTDDYRLCLLTNKDILLDNNSFMEARIEMIILVALVLVVLLMVSMSFARRQDKLNALVRKKSVEIDELQGTVGQLNELLIQKENYDTRYQLWEKELIKTFLEKLKNKNIETVVTMKVHCVKERHKILFFNKAKIVLDKKVLRFALNEKEILLMFIQHDMSAAGISVEMLLGPGIRIKEIEKLSLGELDIDEYVRSLDNEV